MVALALALAAASLAGGHAHHFAVSQVGLPMEEVVGRGFIRSVTQGQGTVVVTRSLQTASLRIQPARIEGRILIRHEDVLARGRLRLELLAVNASLASFADGSRLLVLTVRVVRSNDPACGVGS